MNLAVGNTGRYIRVIAMVTLLLGLNDAARLLGVQLGPVSPISVLGSTGFILLSVFALSRLFAAVGLWIKSSWGAVLLVGGTSAELVLYLTGSKDVQMTMVGFLVRLALLTSILLIFLIGLKLRRDSIHE